MKSIGCIVFCLLLSSIVKAQFDMSAYLDGGENNVSEGFYMNTAVIGGYQYEKFSVVAGAGFDLISPASNVFTNVMFMPSRTCMINNFQFETQGLFMYNRFSEIVHEINWGALINIKKQHFTWKLGTEFRTYHITQDACDNYDIESNRNLHENWNMMYMIDFLLKPREHVWNISLALTNLDYFLINQEANPMFRIRGKFDITPSFVMFSEAWYKSAGAFNISVNYFGFFIRTGITWEPNMGK
jgi:hypothetical protein